MKTYKHLFEKLITRENIRAAIHNSAKGKTKRRDVKLVLSNIDKYIEKVRNALCNKTLKPKLHKAKLIIDKSSKKERIILQPKYIIDQIIHHAVIQVLEPILLKGAYEYSCGSIVGKGGIFGKRYIERFIRENKPSEVKYILKFDIRHYFQTIDVNILKEKFKRVIADADMLEVIFYILDSNKALLNDELIDLHLPIGNYPSQCFANWNLQEVDHFIKEKLKAKCYIRYMDDFVIFGNNKKKLHKDFLEIKKYLENLNLEIKANWQIFKFDYTDKNGIQRGRPLDFMGYKFYRNRTVLRRTIMLRATRKAANIGKKKNITWFDSSQMISYLGWFSHAKCNHVYTDRIRPYVNVNTCKKLIGNKQRRLNDGITIQRSSKLH